MSREARQTIPYNLISDVDTFGVDDITPGDAQIDMEDDRGVAVHFLPGPDGKEIRAVLLAVNDEDSGFVAQAIRNCWCLPVVNDPGDLTEYVHEGGVLYRRDELANSGEIQL